MMRTTSMLAALAMMAVTAPARAGAVTWGPFAGDGEFAPSSINPIAFSTTDAFLTIEYQPPTFYTEAYGYLDLYTPETGEVVADTDLNEYAIGEDELVIMAGYRTTGFIGAELEGDLAAGLASMRLIGVSVSPGPFREGIQIAFWSDLATPLAPIVPEPPSGLLLALGLGGVGLLGRRRRVAR